MRFLHPTKSTTELTGGEKHKTVISV